VSVLTLEGPRCEDPTHRSYSLDRKWDECQFASYAETSGLIVPTWPAKVAVGSAVDEMVKAVYLGENLNAEQVLAKFYGAYGVTDIVIEKSLSKVQRLFGLWEREVRPAWDKVGVRAVEWELHFDIEGVTYHVHPDVVLDDATVIDLKTSDQRLDRTGLGRADFDVQLTTYAAALWINFGELPPKVILDGLIDANPPTDVKAWNPKADKPWWDRQVSTRTEEQLASFREGVRRREFSRRTAKASGIYQTQGTSHPYACKSCPAKAICPALDAWQGVVEGSIEHGEAA
jgi:hypothetical protein